MSTQAEMLGFHGHTFQPPTAASAVYNQLAMPYPYQHSYQDASSAELASLANQFNQHTLRPTPDYSQHQQPRQVASHSTSPPQDSSNRASASVQPQRQATAPLQSQVSHIRDLSDLMEQMVASGEQCHTCTGRRPTVAPEWEEDETLGEEEDDLSPHMLSYRRSADLSQHPGYVTKNVRVRKRRRQRGETTRSTR